MTLTDHTGMDDADSDLAGPKETRHDPLAFRDQVRDLILDEDAFVQATFSGRRRGYELPWRRVTVRPVAIRGERHVQISYIDERQDVTKNFTGEAVVGKIDELVALPFSQIHVVTTTGEVQVRISRKGIARVHQTQTSGVREAPRLAHDRRKERLLPADEPDPFLQAVGIQTEAGHLRADKRRKYRQIDEFLRLVVGTAELEDLQPPVRIVDCGCGSADLTFAAFHYLNHIRGVPAEAVGVDIKADLVARHNALAGALGWQDTLHFEVSRIVDYQPVAPPDIVLALHACDTATDEALAQAVGWNAKLIFSAPCCHHDLQAQMSEHPMPPVFTPVLRHGILKERLGDVLTDSFRAQILRILGYRTDVVQFVSSEHTARNLMIRAVKTLPLGEPQQVAEYHALASYWEVKPYLAHLLAAQLAAVGVEI